MLVSAYYGGGGGSRAVEYLWEPRIHTKSQFRLLLTSSLDWWKSKDRYVLINKPLTHLEKWIKGFVRLLCLGLLMSKRIYQD